MTLDNGGAQEGMSAEVGINSKASVISQAWITPPTFGPNSKVSQIGDQLKSSKVSNQDQTELSQRVQEEVINSEEKKPEEEVQE